MEITIDSLANNPLVTLASFVLAVISITLAIIFYVRSRKEKIPCYEITNNTVIEGLHKSLDGLAVQYKGIEQHRVTVTKVAFWNAGRDTIDKSDLIEKNPLRIKCPKSVEIMDIQITDTSSDSNSVIILEPIEENSRTVFPLSFEYLDHKEYFVVQIIHNGRSTEEFDMEGKIKGVKSIEHVMATEMASYSPKILKAIPLFGSFDVFLNKPIIFKYSIILIYLCVALVLLWNLITGETDWYIWVGAVFCVFAVVFVYYHFRHISPVKI